MSVVFKYRKPDSYGWRVLERGALWLSSPVNFNDQEDMRRRLPHIFDTDRETIFRFLVRNSLNQDSSQRVETVLTETSLALHNGMLYEQIRFGETGQRLLDAVRLESGVISFGRTPDNRHLWEHYAQKWEGFCLGFETKGIGLVAHDVIYDDRPSLSELRYFESPHNAIREALCLIKGQQWRPEDEARIIIPRRAGQELTFDPGTLTRVICGSRMVPRDKDKLRCILAETYPHVTMEVARWQK